MATGSKDIISYEGVDAPAGAGVDIITEDDRNMEDAADPIKVMADNHNVLRIKLEKANKELADKQRLLQTLESECYLKEGALCIAEQNLRSLNEKLFNIQNSFNEKEKLHEESLKELVEVQWAQQKAHESILKVETQYVDFQVEKAIREDEVARMEAPQVNANENRERDAMKKDVQTYEDYKDRLAKEDYELKRIMSGELLVEIEKRKDGIRDAFAERDARAEMVYLEIDEKNDAVDKLNQSLQIKEKQNQARLRKLRKEILDKEETESHLKQTVEYLERQIDPALKNANSIRNNFNPRK